MAPNANATERTEPERFEDDVSGTDLIEGDRIDPQLVARTPGQLGGPINPHEDAPDTQLVAVTEIDRYDDVHSAILVDPETRTLIRASRHSRQSAWNQKEYDWTVREVGQNIRVTDATVEKRPDDEQDESEQEYMQTWVEILFDELARGHFDMHDERKLNGPTLILNDYDGRKGFATITLE